MKRFLVVYVDEATDETVYKNTYGESIEEVYERFNEREDVYVIVDVIEES